MFGLAMTLNYLTFKDTKAFFIYLTLFNALVYYGNLLPLWSLVLNFIVMTVIIYYEVSKKGGL